MHPVDDEAGRKGQAKSPCLHVRKQYDSTPPPVFYNNEGSVLSIEVVQEFLIVCRVGKNKNA